jgi:hypothetical protein
VFGALIKKRFTGSRKSADLIMRRSVAVSRNWTSWFQKIVDKSFRRNGVN